MTLPQVARDAIRAHLSGTPWTAPPDGPPSHPVFVSLRSHDGALRGCIGHLEPTEPDLFCEVAAAAVLAATEDPRFPKVTAAELAHLELEVSVLTPSLPCTREDLDPARYGVVVRSGSLRGVLLPDLEGVDTVARQLDIACRKAGIHSHDSFEIERFEVVKHR